jgi:hypothetical protein
MPIHGNYIDHNMQHRFYNALEHLDQEMEKPQLQRLPEAILKITRNTF